jgi:putative iron-regulated protein
MTTTQLFTRSLLAAMAAAVMLHMDERRADAAEVTAAAVLETYADIAQAGYEDALATARELDTAIDRLIAAPSPEMLDAARSAWLAARVPYQQTEVYRFGNAIVDDWEGKVNAWPLDEGLIDYVEASYGTESDENPFYTVNVVANETLTIGGEAIDAAEITPDLLQSLHEVGDVEANVSTGYHAIEFLLWGQDLNGTGPGAGARPHTDFDAAACTGGNCARRAAYLKAASALLVSDLDDMAANWTADGAARATVVEGGDEGLTMIVTGMGSLSYGELAGERMKLGLMLHDPEEEHDCFSDNTHNSHYYDALGIANVYLGRYARVDGTVVEGASLAALVASKDGDADATMQARLEATMAAMDTLRQRAETGEAYDQMIGSGNDEGNAVVQAAVDALLDQTQAIETIAGLLGLADVALEGSDSLDDPASVFE